MTIGVVEAVHHVDAVVYRQAHADEDVDRADAVDGHIPEVAVAQRVDHGRDDGLA